MKESIKTLVSICAQQMDMTHKACKQTSALNYRTTKAEILFY